MAVTILLGLCLAICMITDIIKRTVDIRVLILFFCMLMICGFIEKNISIHNITAGLFAAALFAALSFVSKGAIGMGDALLYSCIVCFVGMEKAFYIIFMSVMFAFFAALYLVIVKRKEKKYEIQEQRGRRLGSLSLSALLQVREEMYGFCWNTEDGERFCVGALYAHSAGGDRCFSYLSFEIPAVA